MADKTGISWTDATWNPIVGCSVVSPGCTNCYAMRDAARVIRCATGAGRASHYEGTVGPSKAGPVWTGRVALAPDHIVAAPLRWRRPRRVFVNSMGDLFHEAVPDEWIDRVFAIMALAPQHTFQILTKRSSRMREYLSTRAGDWTIVWPDANPPGSLPVSRHEQRLRMSTAGADVRQVRFPLPNVWLGVTAEDQARADDRIPDLLETPAAVRFVSVEPMLGRVRLDRIGEDCDDFSDCGGHPDPAWPLEAADWTALNALTGRYDAEARAPGGKRLGPVDAGLRHVGGRIDWVICGGESGPGARPMHPDWARSLRDQCAAALVPFFFKQWGEYREVETPAELIADDSERADELFNRAVNPSFIQHDGTHIRSRDDLPWNEDNAARLIERIGTARAGHLLDGREHHEFPGVPNG